MKNLGKAVVLTTGIVLTGAGFSVTNTPLSLHAEAAAVVKIPKTTYQTNVNLVLRSGAGNQYSSLLTIQSGKIVTSHQRIGNWYNVSYTYSSGGKNVTRTGWVWGSYLQHHHSYSSMSNTYLATNKSAYLYPTPDTGGPATFKASSDVKLQSNQKVVNSRGVTVYRVSYQGKTVYVKNTDVFTTTAITPTTYKSSGNITLHTGPGNSYASKLTVPAGGILASDRRIGNWYHVTYENGSSASAGWVWGSYLQHYHSFTAINETTLTSTRSAYLYPTADTGTPALYKVDSMTNFRSTQKAVNSRGIIVYRVSYQGKNVYIKAEDSVITTAISKTNYQTNVNVNLRSGPGNSYSTLLTIPKGTAVASSQRIGNWYQVSFSSGGSTKTGWVWGSYLQHHHIYTNINAVNMKTKNAAYLYPTVDTSTPASYKVSTGTGFTSTQRIVNSRGVQVFRVSYQGKTVYVKETDITSEATSSPSPSPGWTETAISGKLYAATANVNLRKEPNTSSGVLTTVDSGSLFYPTHQVSNGWVKINYGGKTGYVSGDYAKQVTSGSPMHKNGYQFIDLRKPSKVTAAQINAYIANNLKGRISVLSGQGQAFINAGNKYGVNGLYLAAKAIHESGFGTSNLSLGKYNLFGFGAYDVTPYIAAYRFPSIASGIEYIAQEIKATYLNAGNWKFKGYHLGYSSSYAGTGTRVDAASEGLNFYYATDIKWGQKIAAHMEKILPYNKAHYDSVSADTRSFSTPARPSGTAAADIFPAGISAVAKRDLALTSTQGSSATVKTLKANSSFILMEKHNDFSIKVQVDGKEYWTKSVKLDAYTSYLAVKNLGRVTATSLNVRPAASTAQPAIGSLNQNSYVHLVLDGSGNPTMDSSKTWYKIKMANGKEGWVSTAYISRELK